VALPLMDGRLAQGGVEGDVLRLLAGRPALDVAAALAIGAGDAAPAGLAARQLVQRRIQPLGLEGLADGDRLLLALLLPGLLDWGAASVDWGPG
jgi:hypothetical protein